MKRLLAMSALCGATILSASAVTFKDHDALNNTLNSGNPSVSGNFNIAAGDGDAGDVFGYSSAGYTITSATATFGITAEGTPTKAFSVDLGPAGVDFNSGNFTSSFTYGLTDNVFGSATLEADLAADGSLNYTITRSSGTFKVTFANLDVIAAEKTQGGPNGEPTPDAGSTFALMGLAAAGICAARRKVAGK
jgi:hypothetical protein